MLDTARTLERESESFGSGPAVVASHLQRSLVDLIDLALQGKHAHWNVIGSRFQSMYLGLDDIVADVRTASDTIAEQIVRLGYWPDGRVQHVLEESTLQVYPEGPQSAATTVTIFANRLAQAIEGVKKSLDAIAECDPASFELLHDISLTLRKHLWALRGHIDR
jgi:starvation-inducible DNA-binding protein